MIINKWTPCVVLLFLLSTNLVAKVKKSVVQISNISQAYLYDEPWKKTALGRGTGTGFVISGQRILTNAHVVSDSRYLEVKKIGDDEKYVAKVAFIAHDCDLALLSVFKPEFFNNMVPLELGELPEINSAVTTYGFPLGGSQISVTRGVVSRIQQWTYSHSGSDAHLVIQTDAAINPGNSGGPVLQNGKVVGVAFQGLTKADNIGYLIPSLVVKHFLDDIQDGKVDGFGELGVSFRYDLQNPMVRKILAIPDEESGVLITRVFPKMPAHNVLKPLDVLLSIEGYDIQDDGLIILDGREVSFPEVMERRQVGSYVELRIYRKGEFLKMRLPLKMWQMPIPHSRPYDIVPNYYIFAGLCFTNLTQGYLMSKGGWKQTPLPTRSVYIESMGNEKYVYQKEFPILFQRLPNKINTGSEAFTNYIIESINGQTVGELADVKKIIEESNEKYLTFRFVGNKVPYIISKKEGLEKHESILKNYNIPHGERL